MPPLSHASAQVLEFETFRAMLHGYIASPLGGARLSVLSPSTDKDWIENQQRLTTEVREFRRVGGRFDFSGLLDITALLENLASPVRRWKLRKFGMSCLSWTA